MALVELEHVTEDEFAKLRKEIASGTEELVLHLQVLSMVGREINDDEARLHR